MKLPYLQHLRRNVLQPMIPFFIQEMGYFVTGKKAPWDISDYPIPLDQIEKKGLQKQMKRFFRDYYINTYDRINTIWSTKSENFGEDWDCGPSHYQLEYSYPLLDRRIVEFLVQIPVAYFYAGGLKRGLIRKAMKGVLPEKIRLRMNKLPYAPADELIYNRDLEKIQNLLNEKQFQIKMKYVLDITKMNFLIMKILNSKKSRKFHPYYWLIIDLSVWIKFINWYYPEKNDY